MHQDSGNTGSVDDHGPLGINTTASSLAVNLPILLWHSDGRLTSAQAGAWHGGLPAYSLAALDPATLRVLSTWSPPTANETLNIPYMELSLTNDILLITSQQGKIYVVHRSDATGSPTFTLNRSVDLLADGVLRPAEYILNAMFDSSGNIWFTTGGILGMGDPPQSTAVIGVLASDNTIAYTRLQDQFIENGIALSNHSAYIVTGPSGAANTTNATGWMYAFTASTLMSESETSSSSNELQVRTLWQSPYPAGSRLKPGGFARGSGTTPALLEHLFVAVTDNSDDQIALMIYPQQLSTFSSGNLSTNLDPNAAIQIEPVCSVPLFEPGASATDLGALAHSDGKGTSSLLLMNTYNGPPLYRGVDEDLNGSWNNMSGMPGGLVRVDVSAALSTPSTSDPAYNNSSSSTAATSSLTTKCGVKWSNPLRMKAVPVLSTKTGLVYGYTQDEDLAKQGLWVWYGVALDWETGEEKWRVRTGSGGAWNDDWMAGAVGSGGTQFQVRGFVLAVSGVVERWSRQGGGRGAEG